VCILLSAAWQLAILCSSCLSLFYCRTKLTMRKDYCYKTQSRFFLLASIYISDHTIDEDGKMSKKKWLGEEGGIVKNGKPHAIKA
jgi:hypothetical protein